MVAYTPEIEWDDAAVRAIIACLDGPQAWRLLLDHIALYPQQQRREMREAIWARRREVTRRKSRVVDAPRASGCYADVSTDASMTMKGYSYTKELADIICRRLEEGESLRTICLDADMPHRSTIHDWLDTVEGFRARYDRAREIQGDAMADLGLDAGLEGDPRLRWDAYRWHASHLAPKRWSDRPGNINFTASLSLEALVTEIARDRLRKADQKTIDVTPEPDAELAQTRQSPDNAAKSTGTNE
jgi:hypothetical protein